MAKYGTILGQLSMILFKNQAMDDILGSPAFKLILYNIMYMVKKIKVDYKYTFDFVNRVAWLQLYRSILLNVTSILKMHSMARRTAKKN